MRIAIVTDTFPPDINGVAMTMQRLTRGLLDKGHEILLITPGKEEESAQTDNPALNRFYVPSIPIPGYSSLKMGIPPWGKIESHWNEWRPDTLYVATESPLGYTAIRTALKLGIPVLSGFHTNFHTYMENYHLPMLETIAARYLRNLHNQTLATFTPSEDTAEALKKMGFERVKVLGRGVDTEMFQPRKRSLELREHWKAKDDTPVVILVGRLAAEKNLSLFFRAYHRLIEQDIDLKAVLVGDGPKAQFCRESHPDVILAGSQLDENLAQHYASADLFLFPSLSETYGNVVVEAMASGLIVVAYDYAAAARHVRTGENGFLAELGNEEHFIQQCLVALEAWKDPARRSTIRQEAVKTTVPLSWKKIIDQFEQELLAPLKAPVMPKPIFLDMQKKLRFKSIFLSDIHLGTPDCKIAQVNHFMRHCSCEKLVLNGDIIDAWALQRGNRWSKSHTYFIRQVLKKIERDNTEVIYLRGNHDDILWRFLPFKFDKLTLANEHIHETPYGKYLVVHGDGFDTVTTNYRWVAILGAIGYSGLLRLNRVIHWFRKKSGKGHFSLAKVIKAKVKQAINVAGNYEEQLQKFAHRQGCRGIICGHIHTPADKRIGEIHYLNSGDWVESMTAIVETTEHQLKLITYQEFCQLIQESPREDDAGTICASPERQEV